MSLRYTSWRCHMEPSSTTSQLSWSLEWVDSRSWRGQRLLRPSRSPGTLPCSWTVRASDLQLLTNFSSSDSAMSLHCLFHHRAPPTRSMEQSVSAELCSGLRGGHPAWSLAILGNLTGQSCWTKSIFYHMDVPYIACKSPNGFLELPRREEGLVIVPELL